MIVDSLGLGPEAGKSEAGHRILESNTHCPDCTIKHLGCALVLLGEADEYLVSGVLAVGHLHEAGRECGDEALSRRLRRLRKQVTLSLVAGLPIDCIEEVIALAAGYLDDVRSGTVQPDE